MLLRSVVVSDYVAGIVVQLFAFLHTLIGADTQEHVIVRREEESGET